MTWKHFNERRTIQTKLIIPILVVSIIGVAVGTDIIEKALNKQIFSSQKEEIKNFSNKLYYILKSDYKTLFYEFGKNRELFKNAQAAAQKETINTLSEMLKETPYNVYILLPTHDVIPLTAFENAREQKDGRLQLHARAVDDKVMLIDNYFVLKKRFIPWEWELIIVKDTAGFHSIIEENKNLIFATIALLVAAIIGILFLIVHTNIHRPFRRVFEHLQTIKRNKTVRPLQLRSSKEIKLLSAHINGMSKAIFNREKQLRAQKQKNEDILNSQSSIVIVSSGTSIIYANGAFFEFFEQYENLEAFQKKHDCICDFFESVEQEDFIYPQRDTNWVEKILKGDRIYKVLMLKHSQGYIFNISANTIGDKKGEYVLNLTDITALERYKERLNKQLHTDELTGLPNRLSLTEKMLENHLASLIIININDFKEVNDFYGTATGDKLLREYGKQLLSQTKQSSYDVFKLSGDEYALYTTEHFPREAVITFATNLIATMKGIDFYDTSQTRKINLTATAGAAINLESSTIVVKADIALKTAKKKKLSFTTYRDSQETESEFASNIQWANRLKQAFKEDRIVPYFQPIFNNATETVDKYECLVRLIDEQGNAVAPFFFLDVAKKSHQYLQLTETMIDKAFAHFENRSCEFSINLSESDLADFSINTMIMEKLQSYDIGPKVVFEIVETENIEDYKMVSEFICNVKSHGAKIAIDDFGAGFSNFQHVSQLNVDYLKIDGSLIQNILIDKNSETIVEAIATFAKRLGIKTIAEFVDSEEVQQRVKEMGIDYTQGYLISKPKPSAH